MTVFTKGLLLSALMTGMAVVPAMATETIKAVVIDGYPARALWVKEFSNFFIPEVDKKLAATGNYKMDWQESYGGSIVKPKGALEGVKLGLGHWDRHYDLSFIKTSKPSYFSCDTICCSRCACSG